MTRQSPPRAGVRAVLYTLDFEPITVVELSQAARERLECKGEVTLQVIEMMPLEFMRQADRINPAKTKTVRIFVEEFRRGSHSHLMLFTPNDENALLLKSAFLPGQRKEVRDERAEAFVQGFMKALSSYGY